MKSTCPSQFFLRLSHYSVRTVPVCFAVLSIVMVSCGTVHVFISSPPQNVLLGNPLQFTATVTGTSDEAVVWSVDGVEGGNRTVGTISTSGLYIAPPDLPSQPTVSVTATSKARSSVSARATFTLTSGITINVGTSPPNTSSLITGKSLQLNETILTDGHPDMSVTWFVDGITNGNTAVGTISSSGQSAAYTAPSAIPSPSAVTIQVESIADPAKSASLTLNILPDIQVSLSQTSAVVLLGNSQPFTATVTGSSNTSVTWSVNGGSAFGAITDSGVYTAPADLPSPAVVMVTATSQADNSKTASALVTVTSDVILSAITTNPDSQIPVLPGATVLLNVTLSSAGGHPDRTLNWSVNGIQNGNSTVGMITATGLDTATYTAPQGYSGPNPADIAVQSVADPSKTSLTGLTQLGVLVGAGDIAVCGAFPTGADLTAGLLSGISGIVFADGDLAYPDGTDTEFTTCYAPTWGPFKDRTRPVLGNHEYNTANAQGYFNYWQSTAGAYWGSTGGDPTKGYYSYDLADWHVVVINSNCTLIGPPSDPQNGCVAGSPQYQWLQDDLSKHLGVCTIAFWHAPYFVPPKSGPPDPGHDQLQAIWQALYDADVHVILNGHIHDYERWIRLAPDGTPDPAQGIRQFVVGTGGAGCSPFPVGNEMRCTYPSSNEEQYDDELGVFEMTLHHDTYDWEFILTDGEITDQGTESCHSLPQPPIRPLAAPNPTSPAPDQSKISSESND